MGLNKRIKGFNHLCPELFHQYKLNTDNVNCKYYFFHILEKRKNETM